MPNDDISQGEIHRAVPHTKECESLCAQGLIALCVLT